MAKKKYIYTIYVENWGSQETYFGIKASSDKEAKEKAKARFIRDYWKKSMLKAAIETKEEVFE